MTSVLGNFAKCELAGIALESQLQTCADIVYETSSQQIIASCHCKANELLLPAPMPQQVIQHVHKSIIHVFNIA